MSVREMIDVAAFDACYRGWQGERAACFYGIRYAEPPVGALRFRPPQRVMASPERLVHALAPGASPPQQNNPVPAWAPKRTPFETGEDCLNLNVFTPACDNGRRPVIVHVFGGGFQTGSINGSYQDDPGFAARGDVVLVRPNMRTGALGFLHLGPAFSDPGFPANRGLLDLVEALRWVRRNIASFGGDPDNVTLVGMSSGAFTIAALYGMDGIDDLFDRTWLMSGSASRIIDPDTASDMATDFLREAQIAPGDWSALEALPLDDLLAAQNRIVATDLGERNAPGGHTYGIVADEVSLKCHPLEGLKGGRFAKKPMVAGWTRDEARMWYAFGIMKGPADRVGLLHAIARFHGTDAETVLSRYESEMPGAGLAAIEERFLTDTVYKNAALRTLSAQADAGGTAYGYEFAWSPRLEGGKLGASHGFDEPFVFGNVDEDRIPLAAGDPQAQSLADRMSAALYAFARTADPDWPHFKCDTMNFTVFGNPARI